MKMETETRQFLIRCWWAGVRSVNGERVVRAAINNQEVGDISHVLALGKAASSMLQGAMSKLSARAKVLLITKYGHVDNAIRRIDGIEIIKSGHPLPDENSLLAGRRAREFVHAMSKTDNLLMLVSGGASALVECLPGAVDLATLENINQKLIADGFSIDQINAIRIQLSTIKGGKLLRGFNGNRVDVYAISDVPGDDINLIGSGIGGWRSPWVAPFKVPGMFLQVLARGNAEETGLINGYKATIVASNAIAREAVQTCAQSHNYTVQTNTPGLDHEVEVVATMIGKQLITGENGVYIWGGEPTIELPSVPGVGGRNQSLALSIARQISGCGGIAVMVGATDGSDGPTDAAGGLVDGTTFLSASGGGSALQQADAGTFLQQAKALFVSGPTGTNVMDLVVALKCAPAR